MHGPFFSGKVMEGIKKALSVTKYKIFGLIEKQMTNKSVNTRETIVN
jgi:hypothetical protein